MPIKVCMKCLTEQYENFKYYGQLCFKVDDNNISKCLYHGNLNDEDKYFKVTFKEIAEVKKEYEECFANENQ